MPTVPPALRGKGPSTSGVTSAPPPPPPPPMEPLEVPPPAAFRSPDPPAPPSEPLPGKSDRFDLRFVSKILDNLKIGQSLISPHTKKWTQFFSTKRRYLLALSELEYHRTAINFFMQSCDIFMPKFFSKMIFVKYKIFDLSYLSLWFKETYFLRVTFLVVSTGSFWMRSKFSFYSCSWVAKSSKWVIETI